MIEPFGQVSHRTQLRRLRAAAEAVLPEYALAGATLRLVQHDFNATFRVDHPTGRFALRINTNSPHGPAAVAAEAAWVEAVRRDTELTVPAPRRTSAGALSAGAAIAGLDGLRGVAVYSWLDGPDLGERASLRRLRALGRAVAMLHEHTATWQHPNPDARRRYDSILLDEPDHMTGNSRIPDAAQTLLGEVQGALQRIINPMLDGPFQLIHGDVHLWNTKWVDGSIAVFDFDDCGWGLPLQDLSISCYYVQDRAGGQDAILEGYQDHRGLPGHTEEQFQALLAARNLLLMNSILPAVNAGMDDFFPGYLDRTVKRLRRWRDTGQFEMS
ncbi:MAG: phosphotransferase [Actinomycetota bacterium]